MQNKKHQILIFKITLYYMNHQKYTDHLLVSLSFVVSRLARLLWQNQFGSITAPVVPLELDEIHSTINLTSIRLIHLRLLEDHFNTSGPQADRL